MAGVGHRSAEEINAIMVKFLPECDSDYARYPMKHSRWLTLGEKDPSGKPAWMKKDFNQGVIKDYVYGRGPGGPAYYHILTKNAYINLYGRITHECPVACCALTKEARIAQDEWDSVRRIIHARHLSNVPDDQVAVKQQIQEAQGTAQMWYNAGQNEQLAIAITAPRR